MPNRHSKKLRGIRNVDDKLWQDVGTAAKTKGSDRSAITRAFYEWYVGRPGATLPQRPTPPSPGDDRPA